MIRRVVVSPTNKPSHRVTSLDQLRAIIPPPAKRAGLKILSELEPHSRRFLACASTAMIWYRTKNGGYRTLFATGHERFGMPVTDTQVAIDSVDGDHQDMPSQPTPCGSLWLVPGVDETLRLNGTLCRQRKILGQAQVVIDTKEVFLQCPKAFVRSALWNPEVWTSTVAPPVVDEPTRLSASAQAFVAASPFALLATANDGSADVSPRGETSGSLVRVIDDRTLFLADRPGNRLADSLQNLLTRPALALVMINPGASAAVTVYGQGELTTDPALLAAAAVQGKAPKLGIVVRIERYEVDPTVCARLWRRDNLISAADFPTMGEMLLDQIRPKGGVLNRLGARIFDIANRYHAKRRLY